jgi:hypothetical protein
MKAANGEESNYKPARHRSSSITFTGSGALPSIKKHVSIPARPPTVSPGYQLFLSFEAARPNRKYTLQAWPKKTVGRSAISDRQSCIHRRPHSPMAWILQLEHPAGIDNPATI